jgi:hypothetical protein
LFSRGFSGSPCVDNPSRATLARGRLGMISPET